MNNGYRRLRFRLSRLGATLAFAAALFNAGVVLAEEFSEPAVFASRAGALDLLIIAKPRPIPSISFVPPSGSAVNPMGWVYEICPRPASGEQCSPSASTVADYGGARLALQQGDTLKIHFVNRLPKLDPVKVAHANDHGSNLILNPTNLHTHGLIVPARAPTRSDPTFGDFVFVSVYNPANGEPVSEGAHAHSQTAMGSVDYRIDIPNNHPSGLFWFHPHVHGLALNQVSSGLAGIITIGRTGDYAKNDVTGARFPDANVRHLIFKDLQVLAAGTVRFENGSASVTNGETLHQQDPDFCKQYPTGQESRQGFCPGADNSGDEGNNYTGGKWYFTVNGKQFPNIKVTSSVGEIWRLTNASGNISYDLQLVDDATNKPLVMQLVAIDGVSISLPQDAEIDAVVRLAGAKFKIARCPENFASARPARVCVSELVMMPSSRAEVLVASPRPRAATLKTLGLTMGSGDSWPAVDLAKVLFAPSGALSQSEPLVSVAGEARSVAQANGVFATPAQGARAEPLPPGCKALPPGHRRRIFFGLENLTEDDTFALGYEEVDARGDPVPGTQRPVARFNPTHPIVCLPLGARQTPVHEIWELVQLSTENHNFHIHQTKFRPVSAHGVVQDNLPLGVATPDASIRDQVMNDQSGVCSIEQWRSGHCASTPVALDIPFSQLGDFVYHCHILEHEDGGMMAKIRVVPSPY